MGRMISVLTVFYLLFCLTGCGRIKDTAHRTIHFVKKQIREFNNTEAKTNTFECYSGFRDWYRFPLKYPYHFLMTDILTTGHLEKYNGGDIQDPMQSSEPIAGCSEIIQLYWNDELVVFGRSDQQYGILIFADGDCHIFPTLNARNVFLEAHYPSLRIEMHSPEYYFNKFHHDM